MKRKIALAVAATTSVVALALGSGATASARAFTRADEPDEIDFALVEDGDESSAPLVLSTDENDGKVQSAPTENEEVEELPPAAVQKANDEPVPTVPDETIDEAEMRALSNQPLFKEFANIIDETAPLPEEIDVSTLDAPGAALLVPENPQVDFGSTPQQSPGELDSNLESLLNETLAVAKIDFGSCDLTPSQMRTFESLDAEIERLWPMWIDAEINRNVVGRRERDWRQRDFTRFSDAESQYVDAPGADWALALDEPFWFQVVDLLSGESFFTKAGDFETIDATGSVALLRDERRYALVIEEGRVAPTGRAMRIKVLKDGRLQGVDATGKIVTDFNLGQIPLFMFQNQSRLDSRDGVFFTPTPFSGPPLRAILNPSAKTGVTQRRLALSNGKPEELFARLVVLCKSKARLAELVTGETRPTSPKSSAVSNEARGIAAASDVEDVPTSPNDVKTPPFLKPSSASDAKTELETNADDFTIPEVDDDDLVIELPEK